MALLHSHLIALAGIAGITLLSLGCEKPQEVVEEKAAQTKQDPSLPPEVIEMIRPKQDASILFEPREVFTGFDGTHTYTFPIKVDGADRTLTVRASDESALTIVPAKLAQVPEEEDNGRYYLVTVKKAGSFTLTASSKGLTTTATVTATAYTTARWTAGEKRYKNGNGGGDTQKACTTCHTNDPTAPDHTSSELAGVDDTRVGETITSGVLADGTVIADYFPFEHKWQANAAELEGLITYLRALPQKKVVAE